MKDFLSQENIRYTDTYPDMVCVEKQNNSELYSTDCGVLADGMFFTPKTILPVRPTIILTKRTSCSITFLNPLDGQVTEESWLSRSPCSDKDDDYCKRRLNAANKWAKDFKNRFEWRTGKSLKTDGKPNLFNLYFHQQAADYWNRQQ